MFNRLEHTVAVVLFAGCLAAAVVGYMQKDVPEAPHKIWFGTAGGDLIFDHAYHSGMAECVECHHGYDPQNPDLTHMRCRTCHYYGEARDVGTAAPHTRGVGTQCLNCHQRISDEISRCDTCHVQLGYAYIASGREKSPFPHFIVFRTEELVEEELPGPVVFDHAYHRNFGVCSVCHHDYDAKALGVQPGQKRCRNCHHHAREMGIHEADPPHVQFIGANCLVSCHEELGDAMSGCDGCHLESDEQAKAQMVPRKPLPQAVVFETDGGRVAFDHAQHCGREMGAACADCHHPLKVVPAGLESLATSKNCRACHYERAEQVPEYEGEGIHPRYIGNNCTTCHDEDDCATCHTVEE